MITFLDLEKQMIILFNGLFKNNATMFGFPLDSTKRYLSERNNNSTRSSSDTTLLYFRIDNNNPWHNGQQFDHDYTSLGKEIIYELREVDCIITIYSKEKGMSFDAYRYLKAQIRNTRFEDVRRDGGFILGLTNITNPINLTALENKTWTERLQFTITFNFRDTIVNDDGVVFTHIPSSFEDVTNSADVNTKLKD